MKVIGQHPSGARAEICPNSTGSGMFDLRCYCPGGYIIHGDWYTSVDVAKQIARKHSFTLSDLMKGRDKGRWKWAISE